MKLIKVLTSILLALSCYTMPVKAESHFITDAGFAITYWLASQGLRFGGDILNFGSGMWDLFQTFLLNKGLTEVDIEALKTKAEQQRYEYDQFGQQVLQIGADLYNYIAQFKEWLIQQFTITPDSETDKKAIFSDKTYNDMKAYSTDGIDFFGTNEPYFGWNTNKTGLYGIPQEHLGIKKYPGRIAFYNYYHNNQSISTVYVIAIEVPEDYPSYSGGYVHAQLDNYGFDLYNPTLTKKTVNGKTYLVYTTNLNAARDIPRLIKYNSTETYDMGQYWYDITYGESALKVTGEVWGADLDSAPTTVSKDANLVTNVPITSSEEFESYLKNSLVNGWEIATPTESTASVEVPSDIQDGEITANWRSIFPFSLPYDYYLLCNLFVADPVRPEFDIKILGQTFSYDLSPLDGVIIIFRDCVCIVFVAGLIWCTKEIIQ